MSFSGLLLGRGRREGWGVVEWSCEILWLMRLEMKS
jgi:hypothetical protein